MKTTRKTWYVIKLTQHVFNCRFSKLVVMSNKFMLSLNKVYLVTTEKQFASMMSRQTVC